MDFECETPRRFNTFFLFPSFNFPRRFNSAASFLPESAKICQSYFCFYFNRVASRILCKRLQRVFGPVLVHSIKDTVKDPFAAVASGESAHGADASAHFHKESFNHVGGAQAPALRGWKPEDREEFFQVGFQAVHSTSMPPWGHHVTMGSEPSIDTP